jgi:hypothetical protein
MKAKEQMLSVEEAKREMMDKRKKPSKVLRKAVTQRRRFKRNNS